MAKHPRPSIGTRLRYQFDLTLAKGSGGLIGWLAVATLIFVVLTGFLLHAASSKAGVEANDNGFVENSWQALMRTLDPGTVTGDEDWWIRSASLLITIIGIFIFSTLIGLIASVIDRLLEGLRKGRGVVPETNHTLILGWSEKLHTIISELQIANENQRGSSIVVLAPHDRVWMEDEINARFGGNQALELLTGGTALGLVRRITRTQKTHATRIVCRSGNPADPADLALVGPLDAKSIIVLNDGGASSDAATTKVLLSLMSFRRDLGGLNVLAEFVDIDNAVAMKDAAGGNLHTVVSGDLIARITAQICRQSGLGAVYQELLDFDGDELYFHDDARLAGARWAQVLTAYETSSPIGVLRASGEVVLNPHVSAQLEAGDRVIAISEDDDTLHLGPLGDWNAAAFASADTVGAPLPPDHLLMVGWNDLAPRVLEHLAGAVTAGSTLDIVIDPDVLAISAAEAPSSSNLDVTVLEADASRIEPLREVLGQRDYERVVLVGYDVLEMEDADARTLLGLVHARRILGPGHRNHGASIVAELLDPRSVRLGRIANPDDFVVSERLTSLLLAQVSENAELSGVFQELLDGQGVEILMRPRGDYAAETATATTWRDYVVAAAQRGESAIGYVTAPTDAPGAVVVNPAKGAAVGDVADVIVVATSAQR